MRLACGGWLLVLAAALAAAGEAPCAEARRPAESLARILAKDFEDPADAGREIAALGAPVRDALLSRLEENDESRARLLAGARLLGLPVFASELQRRARAGTPVERLAGLSVLTETGSGTHVPLALALALADLDGEPSRERERALRDTLRSLLDRQDGFRVARDLLPQASDAEGRALVDAVAADADTRSLDWLAFQIDAGVDLLPLLLSHVAAMAPRVVVPPFARVRTTSRGLLRAEDGQIVRLAILAVGGLRDADSSALLVELTRDERPGVREAAFHALREVSGLDLPSNADSWTARFEQEDAWRRECLPGVLADLHGVDRRAAVAALAKLVHHRWWRDELALEIAPVLEGEAPELRRVAIEALGALESPFGACPLVPLLHDETLADEAHATLQDLTGFAFAADDLEAWMAALPGCFEGDAR